MVLLHFANSVHIVVQGLLNAINVVFSNIPHRYCLSHIYANFQTTGFRGEELKKHMDAASYSYTKHGFDAAMDKMNVGSEEAWKWLRFSSGMLD
jgi:hypothetical protein